MSQRREDSGEEWSRVRKDPIRGVTTALLENFLVFTSIFRDHFLGSYCEVKEVLFGSLDIILNIQGSYLNIVYEPLYHTLSFTQFKSKFIEEILRCWF